MGKRILVIQGHPDPRGNHFCHALADAYIKGAGQTGHETGKIDVTLLDVPFLKSEEDWKNGTIPVPIREAQEKITWAEHIVIIYPLWLGTMPAVLKAFLEQVFRPGFAIDPGDSGLFKKRLTGKSARIIVTMGMPAFFYRWFFRAHSLKNLERNILHFVGIKPVRETLIGMIANINEKRRTEILEKTRLLGQKGA
jgi:putative NADPH-quinone reductase